MEKLEEGDKVDKVVLLRKLSRDWDWEIDGKWAQAVSIGLGERVATVSIDYVKPLSNKKRNVEIVGL